MLQMINLNKKFNDYSVINNANLEISKKGLYIIYGENGCGKSTFIKIVAGMLYKSSGKLIRSGKISYLPDKFTLPRLMSVKSYLKLVIDKDNIAKLDKIMDDYKLPNKLIGSLSKGNLEKVGIIQTLFNKSDIYLFDEPIDGLDDYSKKLFKMQIKDFIIENKIIIMALHNKTLFNDLEPRVYYIKEGIISEKKKRERTL